MRGDPRQRRASAASPADDHPASSTTTTTTTTTTGAADTASAAPQSDRPKIDPSGLYDQQQVKRLLDDEVIAFMESQGYDEAVLVSNIKILFGAAAVVAAVYSHFNPWEFPANRTLVLSCVLFYGFCIAVINVASYLWEASAVFVGSVAPRARQVGRAASLPESVWVATSIGAKGTSEFKVEIRTAPRQKHPVSVTHPYESYFTEQGRFLDSVFRNDMYEALQAVPTSAKKEK